MSEVQIKGKLNLHLDSLWEKRPKGERALPRRSLMSRAPISPIDPWLQVEPDLSLATYLFLIDTMLN